MQRTIISCSLCFVLLLSHVGLPVYTHVCHSMQKSWSSIYVPAKSCCSLKESTRSGAICLTGKDLDTKGPAFTLEPCCENIQDILQLDAEFSFSQLFPGKEIHLFSPNFPVATDNDITLAGILTGSKAKTNGPARMLYGRSLLVAEQVFRC